jgi:hypothetical protein
MTNLEFKNIKKGTEFLLTRISSGSKSKLKANGKSRACGGGRLERLSLNDVENPNGCKYWLYSEKERISLAHGNGAMYAYKLELINQ